MNNQDVIRNHLQKCVNLDYNTLLKGARESLMALKPYIIAYTKTQESYLRETDVARALDDSEMTRDLWCVGIISIIISRAVFTDCNATETELKFAKELFGLDEKTMRKIFMDELSDGHTFFNEFVDSMDRTGKLKLLDLITYIFACDNTVKVEEQRLIYELLGKL